MIFLCEVMNPQIQETKFARATAADQQRHSSKRQHTGTGINLTLTNTTGSPQAVAYVEQLYVDDCTDFYTTDTRNKTRCFFLSLLSNGKQQRCHQ